MNSMDRRQFLKDGARVSAALPAILPGVSAFGATGIALAGQEVSSAAAAAAPRNLKLALKYGMIRAGNSIDEKFAAARAAGFDGIEMDGPLDLPHDEILAARDKHGLLIPSVVDPVHWQKPLSHPDAAVRAEGVAGLRQSIENCKAFGGDSVLLVPAIVNGNVSYDDAWKRSTAAIREVLPMARELGIRIAIENVWNNFLLSPMEAARYTDEIDGDGPPVMGWHFDIGNILTYGWPDQWIRILGKRVIKLDIKEFSMKKRNDEGMWRGFDVKLTDGDVNWPAVMKALDDIGYAGWMAAEMPGGDLERISDVARRMRNIRAM